MRKSTLLSPVVLLVIGALTGCGATMSQPSAAPTAQPAMSVAESAPAADAASAGAGAPSLSPPPPPSAPSSTIPTSTPTSPTSASSAATGAKSGAKAKDASPDVAAAVIYTGSMTMRAKRDDYAKSIDKIVDVAEAFGGAISARHDDAVEVHVPSASFRKVMSALDGVGEVESRSVSAQDVSEEMHDLDVRLLNLKATRKRLEEFLNRATNVEGTLQVERELERVAMETDRIEGRLAYLRAHTSMSTIAVVFHEKPKDAPIVATHELPKTSQKVVGIPAAFLDTLGVDPLLTVR